MTAGAVYCILLSNALVPAPTNVILDAMLTHVLIALRARPSTPLTRALLAEADRYHRALAEWERLPPSGLQRATMFDCVVTLRVKVAQGLLPLELLPVEPRSVPAKKAPRIVRKRP